MRALTVGALLLLPPAAAQDKPTTTTPKATAADVARVEQLIEQYRQMQTTVYTLPPASSGQQPIVVAVPTLADVSRLEDENRALRKELEDLKARCK